MRYRLDQARTALADAKCLLDGSGSPQSIINRSYYAMFYAVLALLQRTGTVPSRHTGVIGLFDSEFIRTGVLPRDLSRHLHRAFDARQAADYRFANPIEPAEARDAWGKASRFVEAIAAHLGAGK
ncbi:MAG TPA: HEPN domain-containing protein [Planctomycetota bacterium]|nr:HEPN domain-containing protein [Planctomycetota bacterium]HRR81832.1 HEPN domain-containing protein [Planctomycetota bacterium]HRT96666.1 HEPN domain-containing protein [Planctomycetota bacterium]